jgi:hypothetical protein
LSLAAVTAAAAGSRRRPGFAFEAVAPATPDALPRMDVPLLAGIAARGPLHLPVMVEDLAQFEAVFGGAAPLVLDASRGEVVRAQLHAAVVLFIANGGRRCAVLRVAHPEPVAEASRFDLAGVWRVSLGSGGAVEATAATLRAASPGRWADGLRVACSLEVDRALALVVTLEQLDLAAAGTQGWVVGDLLRLRWGGVTAYVGVAAVERPAVGLPGPVRLRLGGPWWQADAGSPAGVARMTSLPAGLPTVERLQLTLWWRQAGQVQRLAGLGLAPGHPRHLLRLPDDAALHTRPDAHVGAEPDAATTLRRRWADVLLPRVPLAGEGADRGAWCLPLGVGALPPASLPQWASARHSGRAAIERDGLVPWTAALFADPALAGSSAGTLLADAEALRVQSRSPRALRGLHAALHLEELSMVAVPDAGWPGWVLPAAPAPAPAPAPEPAAPAVVGFGRCTPEPVPVPPPAPAPVPASPVWQLLPARHSLAGRATLLAVQRLMLRWALARGDAVALLSLPAAASDAEALGHRERLLTAELPLDDGVPALLGTEHAALGLAALVHGGVLQRQRDGSVWRCVADGAWAGLIARRTLARGAWIAPANEALQGVVALQGAAADTAVPALLEARVSVLASTPRGLVPLNADTLGPGPVDDAPSLAARRLLQLLRRLALREGQAWVFEPHDAAFRRGVQRSLEALLRGLFERGAFAGRRAEDSFQVVAASEALNSRASVDAGRFIVELRVAPAQPLAFVTIRLVRSGDGLTLE